jgi:signal transduction histidine kinase/ActR/RegA family two-component response regulator
VGHSAIPRDIACCEVTVNLPAFPPRNDPTSDYSKNVFVVDDLTKHPTLNTRPYVTDYPNGRSYVGVPITTPTGINIGAYCILDDKPRNGITQSELVFMRDMSQTVMSHLETVRAFSERSRRNQMVSGLGSFVRKLSSLEPEHQSTGTMPLVDDGKNDAVIRSNLPDALVDTSISARLSSQSTREEYFDDAATSQQGQESTVNDAPVSPSEASLSADLWKHVHQDRQNRFKAEIPSKSTGGSIKSGTIRPPLASKDSDIALRTAYQRAAETLCRSLKIDGVAFLDASVRVFGGLAHASDSTEASSTYDESDGSASAQYSADSQDPESCAKQKKVCPVLGCAQTTRNDDDAPKLPAKKITESVLGSLLRRYPTGNVWLYSEDGTVYSEGESSTDEASSSLKSPTYARHRSGRERRDDSKELQRAFPGARCIAIHGMYDHTRKRWAVGSLFWSYDPFRILSRETEMPFVATFCDIIVAETKRLETLGNDRTKSDFISSISHELRSPLHGILGSTEMLGDLRLDPTTVKLVEQIDSCGHTLLEIIDHLLDFAGLRKTKRRGRRAARKAKAGRTSSSTANNLVGSIDLTATRTDGALDTLTEEAVSTAAYSFHHDVSVADRTNVPVILDIDHTPATSWHTSLPAGAWKRVCLNLVTNALKYTPAGFVRAELKQKARPGFRRRFDAVLTVSDSGIGMSREFQKRQLFLDFSQENPMSNGLGLGMNMVARILKGVDGTIEVNSSVDGTGTRVTVTVPLDSGETAETSLMPNELNAIFTTCKGVVAGFVTGTVVASTSREDVLQNSVSKMAIFSIEKKCKFLGMQTRHCLQTESASTSLRIVSAVDVESCFRSMQEELQANPQCVFSPMLIVCSNEPVAQVIRDRWISDPVSRATVVECIALPCSLKQLARVIEYLLQPRKSLEVCANFDDSDPTDGVAGEQSHESAHPTIKLPPSQLGPEAGPVEDSDRTPIAVAPTAVQNTNITHDDSGSTHTDLADRPATHDVTPVQPIPLPGVQLPPRGIGDSPAAVRTQSRRCDSTLQSARDSEHTRTSAFDAAVPPSIKRAANDPVLLIVDDNAINLQLLTMFATKHKYSHVTAGDGEAAVKAFQSAHESRSDPVPTIVLMDINMPICDGYEATQAIRMYEKKHHMAPATIFAVTALQSEAARVEAFGSGFDKFLSKPVKLKQLAKMIQDD